MPFPITSPNGGTRGGIPWRAATQDWVAFGNVSPSHVVLAAGAEPYGHRPGHDAVVAR